MPTVGVEFAKVSYTLPRSADGQAGRVLLRDISLQMEAGTTTAFYLGSGLNSGQANFDGHYEYDASVGNTYNPSGIFLEQTTAVGSYQPNAWGLYDMIGNVLEWCQDWYGTYPAGSVTDPQGAATGSDRVIRGGCWDCYAGVCRSADHLGFGPVFRYNDFGFRVLLAPGQ